MVHQPRQSFKTAKRQQIKASIMLESLSGKGKTGLSLAFAFVLASDPSKVFGIDTENDSMLLYEGIKLHTGEVAKGFQHVSITEDEGYSPSTYLAYRDLAIKHGAEVCIKDSVSHAWTRQGGVLDLVSKMKQNNPNIDNYRIWGNDKISSEKNSIFEMIRSNKTHMITTVRVKEKQAMEYDESKQKTVVTSLGEQQLQQDGLKYEPDLVLQLVSSGKSDGTAPVVLVKKSRYPMFPVDEEVEVTLKIMQLMKAFLEEGTSPEEIEAAIKKDYVDAITTNVKGKKAQQTVLKHLKKQHGVEDVLLKDINLDTLRKIASVILEDN